MLDRSTMSSTTLQCMGCISLEVAAFIFACFSAVSSALAVLALCLILTFVTNDMQRLTDRVNMDYYDAESYLFKEKARALLQSYIYIGFLYIITITSFIFSVFLCYGVNKRRIGFVKLYLIYGIVVTVLMMFAAFGYSWITGNVVGGSFILMGCGFYSLLLLMVQRTYEQFRDEASRDQEQLLDTKPCFKA